MPTPRAAAGTGIINGEIYVLGGLTDFSQPTRGATTVLEKYTPATDSWTTLDPAPLTPAFTIFSTVCNNQLFAVIYTNAGNSFEVYDPASGWSALSHSINLAPSIATINNAIYFMGGVIGSDPVPTNEVFYPATSTSETKTPMPQGKVLAGVAVVGSDIYLIGGQYNGGITTNDVEKYNTENGSWSALAPMQTARIAPTTAVIGRKIYVFGGVSNLNETVIPPIITPEVYDIDQDSWQQSAPYPRYLMAIPSPVINGKMYLIGGANIEDGTVLSSMEIFTPR